MSPLAVTGLFTSVMENCYDALKIKRENVIDFCDIFIKDPLIDWLKAAK